MLYRALRRLFAFVFLGSIPLITCTGAFATGSLSIVWNKNDPGKAWTNNGTIGTETRIHIHFPATGVSTSPAPYATITAHEVAGHLPDQVMDNVLVNNESYQGVCPECGSGGFVLSKFWQTT